MIEEPRFTTVAAVPEVPVIVMPLAAVIAAELLTAMAEPVVVALKLTAPAYDLKEEVMSMTPLPLVIEDDVLLTVILISPTAAIGDVVE
jgi:hypothetical protein